ncbi:MAG: hypothetical protein ACR2QE_02160 [Acidimicrobiales bacterium]
MISAPRRAAVVLATVAVLVAACGSDDAEGAGTGPATSVAAAETTSAPAASVETTPTTVPLVEVPGGSTDPDEPRGSAAGPTTTRAPGAAPAATSTSVAPTQPTSPPPAASIPPESGIDPDELGDIGEIIGAFPAIDPPEGAGTAIRATIAPIDNLAVGDVVTIEASNLPANQWMAWGQCTEAAKDSADLIVLFTQCGGFGFDQTGADGTTTQSVVVQAAVGGVDCIAGPCYIGILVLPGTEDFRRYEQVTITG